MSETISRKLKGKIDLNGVLTCLSGLHVGASKESMEIGGLDAWVVRDPITDAPYIPGSSFKGKLRALAEKAMPEKLLTRNGGTARNQIWRHECNGWEPGMENGRTFPGAPNCEVCRLFGSTGTLNYPARLKVRDLIMADDIIRQLKEVDTGLYLTEWKFENGLDRVTSAANPRSLERVPRGAEFEFSMIYDVEDEATLQVDLENLKLAVRILHDDALGGHGSRGYGWVKLEFGPTVAKKVDWYRTNADTDKTEAKPLDQLSAQEFAQLTAFFREAKPDVEEAA